MKYVKLLSLVGAGVVLWAILGAGMASATVLCANKLQTNNCVGGTYPATTEVHAVLKAGTVSKITTGFKNIECGHSTIKGKIEAAGGAAETIKLPDTANNEKLVLTFEECNCEVAPLAAGDLEIHQIAATDNGTVTSNGTETTVSCSTIFGNVHCLYSTSNTDLEFLRNGAPASFEFNVALVVLSTSSLCTQQATWTAEYEITSPNPLYVSAA